MHHFMFSFSKISYLGRGANPPPTPSPHSIIAHEHMRLAKKTWTKHPHVLIFCVVSYFCIIFAEGKSIFMGLKVCILVLKFLILALNFPKYCPKISPNFLSESAWQPVSGAAAEEIRKVWLLLGHLRLCLMVTLSDPLLSVGVRRASSVVRRASCVRKLL